MNKTGIWLSELTSEEVASKRDATNGVIILPIGSTEQHGNHLPVGTDALVAQALADDASEETGVLAAPALELGWAPHHLALPGTISIEAEHLIDVVYDMVKSLALHDFQHFVIINGHRIVNIPWMQIAAERCKRELEIGAYIFDPAYASKTQVEELNFEGVGHAEDIETSHMLHCYPDLVDMEKAEDFQPEEKEYYYVDPSREEDTLCYVPSTKESVAERADIAGGGASGTPSKSSEAKGEKYHQHLVNMLVEILTSLKENGSLPTRE